MESFKTKIVWRLWFIYWLMFILGFVILGKAIYIQAAKGKEYREMAEKTAYRLEEIDAIRGNILGDDGSLLATTVPIFDVRMDVANPNISKEFFNKNLDSLALGLSKLFPSKNKNQWKLELKEARKKGNRYYLIRRNVDYATLKKIKTLPILREGKNKGGLILIQKNLRKMPYGMLARRTIGYENKQENLLVGLEGAYDEELKGINGNMVMQRIAGGEWIPYLAENRIEPKNGKDIVTTINIKLQDVAEQALLEQLKENDAHQGCVVLMEVATGDIKVIANLRKDKNGNYDEIYNYAIAESIEPGSTFKLASLVAVMEYAGFDLKDSVPYQGSISWSKNAVMKDDHPLNTKYITLEDAFAHSSNVGVSKIVYKAFGEKPKRFSDALYNMGLGKSLGIEIPGEGKPFIKKADDPNWSKLSLPYMAIGYELKITPLQTLAFYNAIANNGVMMKPRFVKEIQEAGTIIKQFEPQVLVKEVCSKKTASKARKMMEAVTERGTAKGAFNGAPYKVAGKTGTAQIATAKKYNKENYSASFVGYFPAENPKYSLIVVVSNPSKGKIYGGAVAAPVFRAIADQIYATELGVQNAPSPYDTEFVIRKDSTSFGALSIMGWLPDVLQVNRLLGVNTNNLLFDHKFGICLRTQDTLSTKILPIHKNILPDLKGMPAKDAVYLLESMGIKVILDGKGKVSSQSLPAGTRVKMGTTITLTLSSS
ncbi:MAG TPA: penicillin-binding protein [Bacteroidales bacterium]|nr:penicillin-binding protein [Bacteroidales bacterium]